MFTNLKRTIIYVAAIAFFVCLPVISLAVSMGEQTTFTVERNFDATDRQQIISVLVRTSPHANFYIEKEWWELQPFAKQQEILTRLDALGIEFYNNIYPTLTSVYGAEWRPGVDNEDKITVAFHAMKEGVAGYFKSADEYLKLQVPESNEREMVYLSLTNIENNQLKAFLAHEFTHLITFNQKDRLNRVSEETWLNETRADYSATILGYDSTYEGSVLARRVRDFLQNPTDSLIEWQEKKYDYGVASMFMHHVVDHYGISVLSDSIKLKSTGIASIEEILAQNGVKENFSQLFTNWVIATLLNDCEQNLSYCYLTENLKNVRVIPTLNFLPVSGNSSLSVTNITKNWSANWQKIIGGNGTLTLEFSSLAGLDFKVPYVVFDKDGNYSVRFLALDAKQQGKISISQFGEQYTSLVVMPLLESKLSGFGGLEFTYPYTLTVSISGQVVQDDPVLIQKLLAQIEALKKQIADLQSGQPSRVCTVLNTNLYIGLANNPDVTCLQTFLKSQGSSIYPEGLITGNFGSLTKAAVVRFQKQYAIPATGFVGPLTRAKINSLL